jgi:metallo-beta-lactamase family protein
VRTTTGSRHLIQVGRRHVLLDCGLFQGPRDLSEIRNRQFPFDVTSVDSLILSHAHIDHSGNIPGISKAGYRQTIHATHATKGLCELMLPDSAHIQMKDVEWVNKRARKRGGKLREPLYDMEDAERVLTHFKGADYGKPLTVCDGVTATFHDAGHILGSAIVELQLVERGKRRTLVFTGDLGRPHLPILRDPVRLPPCDVLLIESTYGNRYHSDVQKADEDLAVLVDRVRARGGKILIPAFAVGRTQEVVWILKTLIDTGRIEPLPIYVDSPLAVNATEVFDEHPECYDAETRAALRADGDPFGFNMIHYIRDVEESKALNGRRETSIIISASGMCEAGRILHHLRNNIEDPRNLVLIVGFQANHTLGKRLVDQQPEVRIFGEEHTRRAEVVVMNNFSAHADRSELMDWATGGEEKPGRTFVIHGNEDQSRALASGLAESGFRSVEVPDLGQEFEI